MEVIIVIVLFGILGGYYVYYKDREEFEKRAKKRQKDRDAERDYERQKVYEQQNQEAIKRDLEALIDYMLRDWNSAIYPDKIETPGDGVVTYEFENGDFLWYQRGTLRWKGGEYTLGLSYKARFSAIFNRIVEIVNKGNTATRGQKRTYSSTQHSRSYQGSPLNEKDRRYQTLMQTIQLRKESLAKMKRNDPERVALENELKAAERVAASMKKN